MTGRVRGNQCAGGARERDISAHSSAHPAAHPDPRTENPRLPAQTPPIHASARECAASTRGDLAAGPPSPLGRGPAGARSRWTDYNLIPTNSSQQPLGIQCLGLRPHDPGETPMTDSPNALPRRSHVTTATRPRQRRYDLLRHDGPVALAAAILEGSANLAGAACTATPRLFDPDVKAADLGHPDEGTRWAAVTRVCRSCPARGRCWQWSQDMAAARRPAGPTAASVANPFRMRRRTSVVVPPTTPPATPESRRRRGARARVRPSIHRRRRRWRW